VSVLGSSKRLVSRIFRTRGPSDSTLIVPVPEVEPLLAAALGESQRSEAGLPPHITLLYPFVPGGAIDEAIETAVAELLAGCAPFAFRLARVASFPGVLYLEPQPADGFLELTRELCARWPELPPYRGEFAEVIPHLTVATGKTDQSLVSALERQLPFEATAEEVWLSVQERGGRWATHRRYRLGGDPSPVPMQRA
jgi:2'-5' RNA ligase